MEFMPEHAPLVALAFLGTLLLLGLALVAVLLAFWIKKKWIGLGAAAAALVLISGYALTLFGVALTSHEKVLAPGDRKYFCQVDCHLAYSVLSVNEVRALGDESHQTSAAGRFVIVRLKTWFDPSTVSPHRGDAPLSPGARRVVLVGAPGQEFALSLQGQAALAALRADTTPLSQPLRPGESYQTDLVFDVPLDVRSPRLFIGDDFIERCLLIDHEDSPLHRKIYLALSPADAARQAAYSDTKPL